MSQEIKKALQDTIRGKIVALKNKLTSAESFYETIRDRELARAIFYEADLNAKNLWQDATLAEREAFDAIERLLRVKDFPDPEGNSPDIRIPRRRTQPSQEAPDLKKTTSGPSKSKRRRDKQKKKILKEVAEELNLEDLAEVDPDFTPRSPEPDPESPDEDQDQEESLKSETTKQRKKRKIKDLS